MKAIGQALGKPRIDHSKRNEDAKAFGLAEKIEEDEIVLVHRQALKPLVLFNACQTQWRMSENGMLVGLDYSGCKVVAKAMKCSDKVFLRMMEIERAFLSSLIINRKNPL